VAIKFFLKHNMMPVQWDFILEDFMNNAQYGIAGV
jgi:hypothetical protein